MAYARAGKLLFPSPSVARREELPIRASDFKFERKLREDSGQQLWRVRHSQTRERFLLKRLAKPLFAADSAALVTVVRCAYALSHPNIIKLYNHFEDDKYIYFVLQHVDGHTLHRRLQSYKQFAELEAAQFFKELLLAVEYLTVYAPQLVPRCVAADTLFVDKKAHLLLDPLDYSERGPALIPALGQLLQQMLAGSSSRHSLIKSHKRSRGAPVSSLARDLINWLLTGENKLTLAQVKDHAWLRSMPILRATLAAPSSSSRAYKVINELTIAHEETKSTIYTQAPSINSSYLSADWSENEYSERLSLEETAFRQSLDTLRGRVHLEQSQRDSLQQECVDLTADTGSTANLIDQLELMVAMKTQELTAIHNRIRTTNEALAQPLPVCSSVNTAESEYSVAVVQLATEFRTKSLQAQILTKKLQRAQELLQSSTELTLDKQSRVHELRARLAALKEEVRITARQHTEQLGSLTVTRDVLEARVGKPKPRHACEGVISDIFSAVQAQPRQTPDSLHAKLDQLHSLIRSKEASIAETEQNYKERKQSLSQEKTVAQRKVLSKSQNIPHHSSSVLSVEMIEFEEEFADAMQMAHVTLIQNLKEERDELAARVQELRQAHATARGVLRTLRNDQVKLVKDLEMLQLEERGH